MEKKEARTEICELLWLFVFSAEFIDYSELFPRSQNFCINKYKFYLFWFRYNSLRSLLAAFLFYYWTVILLLLFLCQMSFAIWQLPLYWYQKAIGNLFPQHNGALYFLSVSHICIAAQFPALAFCFIACSVWTFKCKTMRRKPSSWLNWKL